MKDEVSNIDLISKNAKLIGGILGTEEQYLKNHDERPIDEIRF